ncbi:MAG: hypothetical protein J5862_00815 [Bacteroidales bacterium]|nr:hypothetical protein [Bacteroidales bacterium]
MNKKNTIRLDEGQLKRVVAEAVKRLVNEVDLDYGVIRTSPDNPYYSSFNTRYSDFVGEDIEALCKRGEDYLVDSN